MSKYEDKAKTLFKEGYNCAQAVVSAFSDELEIDKETVLKLTSSFGGGMGRLREVCGAVSGMFMVAGLLKGYVDPQNNQAKTEHYKRIQELARQFKEINGSIVCRELLGLSVKSESHTPQLRTEEYYKKRPCAKFVGDAARILEEMIRQDNIEGSNNK
jgi:C_GCAxxG_C_C family probable redox protein